ncbi:transient receptor potential cation channel protein painless-like [Planococcus citri]|uniref:transient receptor potential cation channel protein painless-like n=1 Tax=Planococcus citri TaxID=170843 RepID=UPI0031F92D8B
MGIRTSKPAASKRNMTVTSSCNSSTSNKSLLIEMDNNSKNTQSSANSPDREILPLMLEEKKFDEFEELVKKRNNYDDIIHFYPDPYNGTLLDIACRSVGNCSIVRFLLGKLANPNLVNKITGKAPIHEVVESGDADMLDELTKHFNFDSVNVIDRQGYTPLHIAAKKNHTRSIRILLECRGEPIDINISTKEHPSPLHLALKEGNKQVACVLLQCPGIDLDFQKDSEGRTCREIIQKEYPNLQEKLLSTDPILDPGFILRSLLTRGMTESFIKLASEVESRYLNDGHDDCSYLHFACHHGYTDVVELLLNKDVDPNKICESEIPIIIASRNGYYEIFEKLFHQPKIELQVEGHGSVLHYIIRGMLYNGQVAERRNPYKCLELVLNEIFPTSHSKSNKDKTKLDIDFVDYWGNTALHLAVLFSDEQIQKSLIYAGAHLYKKNHSGEVALNLIRPEVLSDYLDDCITEGEKSVRETDREINFEYKLFVNPSENSACRENEMEFFTIIERVPELRIFLKHPVAKSFLYIKWNFVKKYYFTNLLFYLLFCVFLSIYIFLKQQYGAFEFDPSDPWCILRLLCRTLTQLFYAVLVLREVCQLIISPKSYLTSAENWLEIILISTVGIVFIHAATSTSLPPICAACAILASLMELVFLIGKHPLFATNIEIFKTVAFNFSKIFGLYSIMIVSFALSFYLLFHEESSNTGVGKANCSNVTAEENSHNDPLMAKNCTNNQTESINPDVKFWRSIPLSVFKTIIMLTGEFSADSSVPLGDDFSPKHVFFILFVFCIGIILYNLLNGLAVSDTQAIRENAEIVALASRVRLISQLEHLVESKPFQFFENYLSRCFPCAKELLEIRFHRGICSETRASIRLHKNNMIYVKSNYRNEEAKSLLKMRTSIVKKARKVLENRSEVDRIEKSVQHLRVHGVKKPPPKFQSMDRLGQYFTTHLHDLESKIHETNAERDEKLVQNVKTLISDSESRMYKRMETLIESTINQQMETLLDSVITELQNQRNDV